MDEGVMEDAGMSEGTEGELLIGNRVTSDRARSMPPITYCVVACSNNSILPLENKEVAPVESHTWAEEFVRPNMVSEITKAEQKIEMSLNLLSFHTDICISHPL